MPPLRTPQMNLLVNCQILTNQRAPEVKLNEHKNICELACACSLLASCLMDKLLKNYVYQERQSQKIQTITVDAANYLTVAANFLISEEPLSFKTCRKCVLITFSTERKIS